MTASAPLGYDIAVLVCSRGREEPLARLLEDLTRHFMPALDAAGLSAGVFVYAQGYGPDYLAGLNRALAGPIAAGRLVLMESERPHARIGDVVHEAVSRVHACARYRLAMLMDDDSTYAPHPAVDANVGAAARRFLEEGHRAYSIKLGGETALAYQPFLDPAGPIMPFKEKMLWVSRAVLDEALALPRFAELSIGEDAVIAGLAWRAAPAACFGVQGLGTFLHLSFESADGACGTEVVGGYADLAAQAGPPDPAALHGKYDAALRHGVTPHHILPDLFVGEDHPHYIFNGVRAEMVARLMPPAAPEPAAVA